MPTGNGEIPKYTDSERLMTLKTDCVLTLQRQRILLAWTPGLLTLKIQRSMSPYKREWLALYQVLAGKLCYTYTCLKPLY